MTDQNAESTAVTPSVVEPQAAARVPALRYETIERMALAIASSGLFGIKTPEQAVALMLVAQAEGRHPASAAMDYNIIQGRPSLKADAILARFQAAGGIVEWQELTDERVAALFHHPISCPKPVLIDWTMERAKVAGVAGKENWKHYPRQMLRARVISEGVRTCYPAACCGMYTPEEVRDFDDKPQPPKAVEHDALADEVAAKFEADTTGGGAAEQNPDMEPDVRSAHSPAACPQCGKPLHERTNKAKGTTFWGCTGYPKCRYTQNVAPEKLGNAPVQDGPDEAAKLREELVDRWRQAETNGDVDWMQRVTALCQERGITKGAGEIATYEQLADLLKAIDAWEKGNAK